MRSSIEPDGKGPVRIAGPAQRPKTRSRSDFDSRHRRSGFPLRSMSRIEDCRRGPEQEAADCSLRAGREGPRPALRVPRREQTAAKTEGIFGFPEGKAADSRLSTPARKGPGLSGWCQSGRTSMLKVRRLPPGAKGSRVKPQNPCRRLHRSSASGFRLSARSSAASRAKTGTIFRSRNLPRQIALCSVLRMS